VASYIVKVVKVYLFPDGGVERIVPNGLVFVGYGGSSSEDEVACLCRRANT